MSKIILAFNKNAMWNTLPVSIMKKVLDVPTKFVPCMRTTYLWAEESSVKLQLNVWLGESNICVLLTWKSSGVGNCVRSSSTIHLTTTCWTGRTPGLSRSQVTLTSSKDLVTSVKLVKEGTVYIGREWEKKWQMRVRDTKNCCAEGIVSQHPQLCENKE